MHISSADLVASLSTLASQGITELAVHDEALTAHKGKLLHFLHEAARRAPDIFYSITLDAAMLDMDVAKAASALYCSLELPLSAASKGGAYLFDKKFYARRATMLNNLGLVFGFSVLFASEKADSLKLFRDRLDFALSLYPNHVDFPQLETRDSLATATQAAAILPPHPSATFSTQDIRRAGEIAFACTVFYSLGRAVPWFLSVLAPLKMSASRFFEDFAEWQRINSCGYGSDWHNKLSTQADRMHHEIETMQLTFLRFKYEEKGKAPLFAAVTDIIHLNGAMARCMGEGEEETVVLQYNPEDILSPIATDIARFTDSVCMEDCRVQIYFDEDTGVDWKLLA